MTHVALGLVARQLGSLFDGGSVAGLSDRQLLERFTAGRDAVDDAAFAAMVSRHGPMVLGVCRQLLGDHQHAEDAFQAVFLVLARRARSIRDPDLLGTWLHGVALRTARTSRGRIARRRRIEEAGADRTSAAGASIALDRAMIEREQAEALHREIDRLPGDFRVPVVLCYFEGLTLDEAAHRLRWAPGTLRSRLARAREKLRRGLTRRGFALSTAALVAALSGRSGSASISPLLCDVTTRAAIGFAVRHAAAGAVSGHATALAREVIASMLSHRVRLTAASFLFLAFVAASAGWLARPAVKAGEPNRARAADQASTETRAHDLTAPPARGRMKVSGRVLDPEGKPVPNASVMVYGASKQSGDTIRFGRSAPAPLGQANCDGSGRFLLEMPRISAATHHMVGAAALAAGYGLGWVDLDVDADAPAAEITLRPEQAIQGRLFDIKGQFAQGVRVSVEAIGHPERGRQSLPEGVEGGPHFWSENDARLQAAWPQPAISDADGRFTIRGVGRDLRVLLIAEDPRFARQRIVIDTNAAADTKQVTAAMEPAKVIIGRVTYADTGKPVPHTAISVRAYRGGPAYPSEYETDADGNFRANPFSTDRYAVSAGARDGEPYLNESTGIFEWTKGASERRVDLVLKRGVALRGKVVEEGSGRPVEGAALGYAIRDGSLGVPACRAWTGADGRYQFAVLPKAGTLAVMGPSDDYIYQEMGERTLRDGRPGGRRQYAHAFVSCDLKPGAESFEVDVVLRRGATVQARVTDAGGQPVSNAWVFSRLLLLPQPWAARSGIGGDFHGDVRNGRYELHGFAAAARVPVYFLDVKNRLGATAEFSVNAAAQGPIAVRLAPCGTALARVVNAKGEPLAGYRNPYLISLIVTPGRDGSSKEAAEEDQLAADGDYLSRVDPEHYNDLVSDAQGHLTFTALIPGATYRVRDMTTVDDAGGRKTRKLFVAGAGETIDLGDILIAKPQEQ